MKIIDSRKFVTVWMQSDNIDEVARKMKIAKTSCYSKANNLRTKGVKLPKMERSQIVSTVTVDELNQIVNKYTKHVAKPVPMKWPEDMAYNKPVKTKRAFIRK